MKPRSESFPVNENVNFLPFKSTGSFRLIGDSGNLIVQIVHLAWSDAAILLSGLAVAAANQITHARQIFLEMRQHFGGTGMLHHRFSGKFEGSIHQIIQIRVDGVRSASGHNRQALLAKIKVPPHIDDTAADMGFPIGKISRFPTHPNDGAKGSIFIFQRTVPLEMLENIVGDQVSRTVMMAAPLQLQTLPAILRVITINEAVAASQHGLNLSTLAPGVNVITKFARSLLAPRGTFCNGGLVALVAY